MQKFVLGFLWVGLLDAAGAGVAWEGGWIEAAATHALPPPTVFIGGCAFDPDGAPLVFDGQALVRILDGGGSEEIYRPQEPVFGSFVKARGGKVYFGESTNGTITEIELATKAWRVVEVAAFNMDLAFDAAGRPFVSALSPNGSVDKPLNGIFLLDLDPATPPDLVVEVPGYSGPLAFGPGGDLFVATAAAMGPADVLRFPAAVVAAGIGPAHATAADGAIFCAQLPGAYGLVFGSFGLLYASDSWNGCVTAIRPDGTAFTWAAPVEGYASVTSIDYDPAGGRLLFVNSDYQTFNALTVLPTDYRFRRGAVNADEDVNIADGIAILGRLFTGAWFTPNLDAYDVNDDGVLDIADPIYLFQYLFAGGPPPPEPFETKGLDPTPDELGR
ncbi:MAG TPA: hypothetical protein PKX48_02095 [Planctomycetota bacterium]|jgi:hypothetical protein|nr:hypothetical protein [Planctomycetota bacterium]OQC21571.1 MAG: hypothetical protein BWX69_00780 [Planctomycetes bacterium ADurb.Bin069]NMD34443.1 hypothetical protein [Planctomycetota bacterium]HNR98563.1 hypothetical protein [Planctomycetota bacterium]HOE28787.1 hypothetical protein [Planctomycetota bacterium]